MERSEQFWIPYTVYEIGLNDAYVSRESDGSMPIEQTNGRAIEEDLESSGSRVIEQLPDAADFPPHC